MVFRADLTLIQVDAVVTDKKGRYVTDLGCGDFEVFEDNQRQPITQCAFVPVLGSPAPQPSGKEPRGPVPEPNSSPGGRIERDAVRRTLVLVVDDLGLDLQSVLSVRTALQSFIEGQMEPGDLVSVLRTGGGTGSLQRFASDKRILRAAIDRVRFNVAANVDAFEPVGSIPDPVSDSRLPKPPGRHDSDELRTDALAEGTVGALRFALSGLRDLPGRKSVVFFSKGYALRKSNGDLTTFGRALASVVDLANRASAVIYTVDTRGVATGQLTAADNMANLVGVDGQPIAVFQGRLMNALGSRRSATKSGLEGLAALSDPTGGLLFHGQNDLSRQVKRMLEDQKGYYLIGYVPSASAFEAERGLPPFHKIRVKVRRRGLAVRSRSGFYGIPDDRRPAPQSLAATLGNAVLSPFQSSGIHLRLNSRFIRDRTQGPLLQSLLRIDAGDLNFEQGADGSLNSRFEILAATFDADDRVVDQQNRIGQLQLTPNGRDEALRRGIRCLISVPVKKPGAYQLRVAVRDTTSTRMGSAYEFVQVPDLGSGRLSLSGVFMIDGLAAGKSAARESASEGDVDSVSGLLRTFAPGRPILYSVTIYNARIGQGGKARLTTRIRLFHAGRLVLEENPRPVDLQGQPDVNALLAGGTLVLPNQTAEGDYELQVIVEDKLGKQQSAVQTADFELTRGEP